MVIVSLLPKQPCARWKSAWLFFILIWKRFAVVEVMTKGSLWKCSCLVSSDYSQVEALDRSPPKEPLEAFLLSFPPVSWKQKPLGSFWWWFSWPSRTLLPHPFTGSFAFSARFWGYGRMDNLFRFGLWPAFRWWPEIICTFCSGGVRGGEGGSCVKQEDVGSVILERFSTTWKRYVLSLLHQRLKR